MDVFERSLRLHESHHGKIGVELKFPVQNRDDLALVYTPGVAEPSRRIASNRDDLYRYTMKANSIAVVTDGSAVLGLGDIGSDASLPVMEGKCMLFKRFAGIDAFPVCIDTRDTEEFISIVKKISGPFGGVNLEDIGAPRCFEIERRLKDDLDIPVFHDDQHGTAIVALAALMNALKVVKKDIGSITIVISGAGAAGSSIADLMLRHGAGNIIVCDRRGAIHEGRHDLDAAKADLAKRTNPERRRGLLQEIMKGADVFIGVSAPNLVTRDMVRSMNEKAIVFAMANPDPEILPDEAKAAGAAVVGTGRSDFPNQINNVLVFPGMFRGALDCRVKKFTDAMFLAAAQALASCVTDPSPEKIIPDIFDRGITETIAHAVCTSETPTR